METNMYIFRT